MLVVSEIRSQEYRISEARAECTRDEERLVGGSDSYPAVAVEKADPLRSPLEWSGKRGMVRDDHGSLFAWEPSCVWKFVGCRRVARGGRETRAGTVSGTMTSKGAHMKLRWILTLLAFSHFVFTVLPLDAAIQTITVTHTYVLDYNDSRNDARLLCFLEAKRKVLELAGTLIQSSSEVKNFELTKDQITSYSAAILSVETVHESFDYTSEQNTLTLTVKAAVDTEETSKQLVAIASDRILQQQIDERLKMLQQLEEAIKRTNTQLARATPEQAGELREERTFVFTVLADLEKGHRVAKK